MLAIFKKEMIAYFKTPMGYVFLSVFLFVAGLVFSLLNLAIVGSSASTDTSTFFTFLLGSFFILIPILTMRSFSEEKNKKTDQLLLTAPIRLSSIVMGKFLAAMSVLVCGLAVIGLYFLLLSSKGNYNAPVLLGNFLGLFCIGAALISIGLFISSTTESQLVAVIVNEAVMVALLLLSLFGPSADTTFLAKALSFISFFSRYSNFTSGQFDLVSLVYYISIAFIFLFLTTRTLEKKRWN
ncbi:MAG: ABC transporter permease [Clostridia bacterium]|nr:ABC transporter permease [Clostridia bacterium]